MNSEKTIKTRKEAKEQGLTRYFTGEPCKYGHVSERRVGDGACCECRREKGRERHQANPEKALEQVRKWREANPEKAREHGRKSVRKWREANRERSREKARKWREDNPEYARKWYQANLDKSNARYAKRRAAKLQRTPPWLTKSHLLQITQLYDHAKLGNLLTGLEYHVDHIVPLQGKKVSGLHVPWNLQLLIDEDNLSKSNREWPETL